MCTNENGAAGQDQALSKQIEAAWNSQADDANHWGNLSTVEQDLFASGFKAAYRQRQSTGLGKPEIEAVVQAVAELPDRTSPADQPDLMLVSSDELQLILSEALSAPHSQRDVMGVNECLKLNRAQTGVVVGLIEAAKMAKNSAAYLEQKVRTKNAKGCATTLLVEATNALERMERSGLTEKHVRGAATRMDEATRLRQRIG